MKYITLIFISWLPLEVSGQDSLLQVNGFVDVYYAYDFNRPVDQNRSYTTQPYRHNDIAINWAFLKASIQRKNVRGTFALQNGTFVEVNYAHEPELFRPVYQANVGMRVAKDFWVDVGVMPSYIGEESTLSIENWNYSRNIATDFLPYYQAGVQFTWAVSEKFTLKGAVMNGYQIIRDNNQAKSFGVLLEYRVSEKLELGYSNHLGNEAPDDSVFRDGRMWLTKNKVRFFNDVYLRFKPSDKLSFSFTGEYNMQEEWTSDEMAYWYTVVFKSLVSVTPKLSIAGRAELFSDAGQIVAATDTENGFTVKSGTITVNYMPMKKSMLRLEGRVFSSEDPIYPSENGTLKKTNGFVAASMAIQF